MSTVIKLQGFRNLGNTCYMNSALQALLSSNIMNTAIMLYLKKHRDVKKFSPMMIEYCRIILDLLETEPNKTYDPRQFKMTLDRVNAMFRGHQQHDSNELLVYLINEFIDDSKDKGISSLIKRLCFGKYKQYIYCDQCKNVSENNFNFLDVVLPIPETKNPDLDDCFKKFAKYEMLDNNNKWMCDTCKEKVVAYKKMEIHEVPEVAIFTFNRFTGMTKNSTPIRIYPFIELEGKKLKLISTVNHYGGTGGGHYVSHVLRSVNGRDIWYRADDSMIREINITNLLNDPSVYMVIYQVVC